MSKAVIIKLNISIHAPREGGDFHILPRAGAKSLGDFNPRPPRGGRRASPQAEDSDQSISIHAPREGGDVRVPCCVSLAPYNFNPRPPRGGRRGVMWEPTKVAQISIHAPREGGDFCWTAPT